jgi:hypothetical protein
MCPICVALSVNPFVGWGRFFAVLHLCILGAAPLQTFEMLLQAGAGAVLHLANRQGNSARRLAIRATM